MDVYLFGCYYGASSQIGRIRQIRYAPEGPVIVKTWSDSALVSADAVMKSLKIQGVAFRGPFFTPAKRIVFVVEKYLFLQSELLDLLAQNKLNRSGIHELAKRIEAVNSRQ